MSDELIQKLRQLLDAIYQAEALHAAGSGHPLHHLMGRADETFEWLNRLEAKQCTLSS